MTELAICGLGNIGRVHLDNLRSLRGCRVRGIFDIRQPEIEGVLAYSSFAGLLRDSQVDAVVIATPTSSHRELTLAALAAGKHVFVEKPLAGTIADAQAIADAAASAKGLVVQVGFCERFNPQYIEAKRAVASGKLGQVRAIYTSRVAPLSLSDPSWELGVLDTAVHNIDLILWMMQAAPESVSAQGVELYPGVGAPHSVATTIKFAGGMLAADQITWLKDDRHALHHCARSRMTILGSDGSFEIDLSVRPSTLLTANAYTMCDTVIVGAPEYYSCLKLQFESFLRSVEEGAPVLAPAADALLAEKVILAVSRSLKSGSQERV